MSARCGAVMPRTTPAGLYVCALDVEHMTAHSCPTDDGGAAMWTDEKPRAFAIYCCSNCGVICRDAHGSEGRECRIVRFSPDDSESFPCGGTYKQVAI